MGVRHGRRWTVAGGLLSEGIRSIGTAAVLIAFLTILRKFFGPDVVVIITIFLAAVVVAYFFMLLLRKIYSSLFR